MPPNASAPTRKSKLPRLTSWWLIALVLSLAVFLIAPQQLPVSLYKLNLISLAAVAGYWIDRKVFPYARPQLSVLSILSGTSIGVTNEDLERGYVLTDAGDKISIEEFLAAMTGPNDPSPLYFMLGCMLRRALIMSATILAISLGG